jgi:hypothetical protein
VLAMAERSGVEDRVRHEDGERMEG